MRELKKSPPLSARGRRRWRRAGSKFSTKAIFNPGGSGVSLSFTLIAGASATRVYLSSKPAAGGNLTAYRRRK
jgi:hypothetical protein